MGFNLGFKGLMLCVCRWFLLPLTEGVDFYIYSDILFFAF